MEMVREKRLANARSAPKSDALLMVSDRPPQKLTNRPLRGRQSFARFRQREEFSVVKLPVHCV